MATQGPLYPGLGTNAGLAPAPENTDAWSNATNISSDNATEASITAATFDTPDVSRRLLARNFGFTIPANATINGVVVEIDRRSIIASSGKDYRVQLIDATTETLLGNNKANTALVWPTTSTVATYGTSSDVWGASLTPAFINDAMFGVVLSAQANIANADIGVDYIRVTVHYTEPQPVDPGILGPSVQFDPIVVPGQVAVTPGLLGTAILLDPMMVHRVSPDLLGGGQIFAPTDFIISDPSQQVVPALLGPSLIHDPVISAGSISAEMVLLGGAIVHDPVVALAPYNIVPALLGTAVLFNPTLQSSVTPGLIGGATLFAPSIVIVQAVQVDILGGAVLYSPEVEMAPVNLFPGVLGVGSVLSPTFLLQLVSHGEVHIGINRPNRLATGHTVIQSSTGHAAWGVIVSHTLEEDS